jgi:bacteriocin-like protein
MSNIKITEFQFDNQINELEELSDSELATVVGGALNPSTDVGKALLNTLEAGLKKAETALEEV